MRFAIYGINRIAKDFLYIFDLLEVTCFIDNNGRSEYLGKPVISQENIVTSRKNFDKIIICDWQKEEKEAILQDQGLQRGRDYLCEVDFFDRLDELKLNKDKKKIAVWGTGQREKELIEWNKSLQVDCYIDQLKGGENVVYRGQAVVPPEKILSGKEYFIIVAVARNEKILELLTDNGYEHGRDYCTDKEWKSRPSLMLRQTIFDRNYYPIECKTMLNHMEIGRDGDVICCCSTFIHHSIGNLHQESTDTIWNSIVHKIMCLSNVNGTYSFCKKWMCPFFIGIRPERHIDIDEDYERPTTKPTTVGIGFDATCNLKCVTCRKDFYVANEKEKVRIKDLGEKIKNQILPTCEFLISAGDGETLLGETYRDILMGKSIKDLKYLRLLSNGLLFNENNYQAIRQSTKAKIMLTVSIDAATKDTYEKIRRGGNFDILKSNMEYAAFLRRAGDLSYLRFNFVVQRDNYREMPLFIRWGQNLGIDELFFTKILNWGTYTPEEFSEISMMEQDGITPKPELREILSLPIMQDKIVDLGTIQFGRMNVWKGKKENYYRWEMERKVQGIFDDWI